MGAGRNKELNQSHYDAIVRYTSYLLVQGLKRLLEKSTSVGLRGFVDKYIESSVNPKDVLAGFIEK